MAAVRARIASGEDLIVPKPDNVLYDDYQIAKRMRYEEGQLTVNYKVSVSEGEGYEPTQGKIALTTLYPRKLQGILGRYLPEN